MYSRGNQSLDILLDKEDKKKLASGKIMTAQNPDHGTMRLQLKEMGEFEEFEITKIEGGYDILANKEKFLEYCRRTEVDPFSGDEIFGTRGIACGVLIDRLHILYMPEISLKKASEKLNPLNYLNS